MSNNYNPTATSIIESQQLAVSNAKQKVLFVGQKTALGSATPLALIKNVGVNGEEDALFGPRSLLASGIRELRRENKKARVDVIALDDNVAGVQATNTITVTGSPTEGGTIDVFVQSKALYKFVISVATGETADAIAAVIDASISASTNIMVTSAVVANVVTLTCVHKGTIGNDIPLRVLVNAPGVNIALSGFSGGITDPVLPATLFDVLGDVRYQDICYASNYDGATIRDFAESRINVANNILDTVVFISSPLKTVTEFQNKAITLNSKCVVLIANKHYDSQLVDANLRISGAISCEMDYRIQATYCGSRSLLLTDGADVSKYVTGGSSVSSQTGGIHMSTLPKHNVPMLNYTTIDTDIWWTRAEQEILKNSQVTAFGNGRDGTRMVLGPIVTTDQTIGTQFKFLTTWDGAIVAREYIVDNLLLHYQESRLTQGQSVQGAKDANVTTITSFLVGLYKVLASLSIFPAGIDAENFFRSNLVVTPNYATGEVEIFFEEAIVSALRSFHIVQRVTTSL